MFPTLSASITGKIICENSLASGRLPSKTLCANFLFPYNGENKVLKGASLTLNKGEIVSLLGVSGGGKTTLFNVLSGISKPDSGRVLLNGDDITGKPGSVSYMLQKDLLLPYRKVIDNVTLPLVINKVSKRAGRASFQNLRS